MLGTRATPGPHQLARCEREMVAIGTELLLGDIVNGNAAWLVVIADIGIDLPLTTAVGGQHRPHQRRRRPCVRPCGRGRGDRRSWPTQDDVTREALAELVGVPLVRRRELEAALCALAMSRRGDDFPQNNLR